MILYLKLDQESWLCAMLLVKRCSLNGTRVMVLCNVVSKKVLCYRTREIVESMCLSSL